MNGHATQWMVRAIGGLAVAIALAGCGGDSEAGGKEGWESKHGDALAGLSTDLDAARGDLSKGDRALILSSCNQLKTAVVETRQALPVPDPASDEALRKALDQVAAGAENCVNGARAGAAAPVIEKSIDELRDGRAALDEAQGAIANWK